MFEEDLNNETLGRVGGAICVLPLYVTIGGGAMSDLFSLWLEVEEVGIIRWPKVGTGRTC